MGQLGVHFALTSDQERLLLAASGDDAVLEVVQETIEAEWDQDWLCETDKAWDAIHRCLVGGPLEPDGTPLGRCVLGGRSLHEGPAYRIHYLTAAEAEEVAAALGPIDEASMQERFAGIAAHGYDGPHDEDDAAATWEFFDDLRAFFARAAGAGRAVVFSVDQ